MQNVIKPRRRKKERKNSVRRVISNGLNHTTSNSSENDPLPSPRSRASANVILGNMSPRRLFGRKKSLPNLPKEERNLPRISSSSGIEISNKHIDPVAYEIKQNSTLFKKFRKFKRNKSKDTDKKKWKRYTFSSSSEEIEEKDGSYFSLHKNCLENSLSTGSTVPTAFGVSHYSKKLSSIQSDYSDYSEDYSESEETSDAPEWLYSARINRKSKKFLSEKKINCGKQDKENKGNGSLLHVSSLLHKNIPSKDSINFQNQMKDFFNRYGISMEQLDNLLLKCSMDHLFPKRYLPIVYIEDGNDITIEDKRIMQFRVSISNLIRSVIISNWGYVREAVASILMGDNNTVVHAKDCILIGDDCTYCAQGCLVLGKNIVLLKESENNRDKDGNVICKKGMINTRSSWHNDE